MNKNYTTLYQKILMLKRAAKQLGQTYNQKRKTFLIGKIQKLYRQLSRFEKFPKLKPAIVGGLLAVGFSVNAQNTIEFAVPVSSPFGFTSPEFIVLPNTGDFDNDGDYDLLNGGLTFPQYGYDEAFTYYENSGTPENANFETAGIASPYGLESSYFIQLSTNVDFDNDGDLDILMGGYIQFGVEDEQVSFMYAENIGTPETPEFAEPVENPFNLRLPQNTISSYPTMVDIDNDGDLDLFSTIVTREDVLDIFFFENIGDAENPTFANSISGSEFGIGQKLFFSMDFADLDGDEDQDILIGEFNTGNVFYYENIGTAEEMNFAESPLANPFGVGPGVNFTVVNFADMDADGDEDLLLGDFEGLAYFENITKKLPIPIESNIFIEEDEVYTFEIEDFLFKEGSADSIAAVIVDSLPKNGKLQLEGYDVVAGQGIEAGKIDQFTYQPNEDIFGDKIDFFTFRLLGEIISLESDTIGLESDTMFVNISSINDAPSFTVSETEVSICSYTTEVVIDINDIDLGGEEDEVAELTVASDNDAIIENVEVEYNENDSTAVLSFNPIGGESGDGIITVSLSDGTNTTTEDITLTIEACLGINDLKIDNDLIAFPNPARTLVNIKWNNENLTENTIVKVFDISGRLIQETKYNNGLNVNSLNVGSYFVATEISGQWIMTKLNVM